MGDLVTFNLKFESFISTPLKTQSYLTKTYRVEQLKVTTKYRQREEKYVSLKPNTSSNILGVTGDVVTIKNGISDDVEGRRRPRDVDH